MPWQLLLSGTWRDASAADAKQLDRKRKEGLQKFRITSRGQLYDIDLEAESWTQTNRKTGKIRQLRLWPPEDNHLAEEAVPASSFSPAAQSWGKEPPRRTASFPAPSALGVPMGPVDRLRFLVWRMNDWHPISPVQEEQIRKHLRAGEVVFDIAEGPYRWKIDTTGKHGWVQISATSGKRRAIKFREMPKGLMRAHSSGLDGAFPDVAAPTRPSRKPQQPVEELRLLDALRAEWEAVSGGRTFVTKDDMLKFWEHAASGSAGAEDGELLAQSAADAFVKVDLSRNNRIEQAEWLHYRLLENQAPSFYALAQVNEHLLAWLQAYKSYLSQILDLFESCLQGEAANTARLTAAQFRKAADKWLNQAHPASVSRTALNQSMQHLKELLEDKDALDDDMFMTYYDFINHILGRRKSRVQLYQYDISEGKALLLSPLLIGKSIEGLWHTAIVVHDKEYWYGGSIFESKPGSTPFGQPTKMVDIPDQTMRTRDDMWDFIRRELCDDFNKQTYDALTHNCNHFTDALFLFLVNGHIPDDILYQPAMLMNTWAARLLRPWLNRMLGRFDADSQSDGTLSVRSTDEGAAEDEWAEVVPGALVVYEYEAGWTCIARVAEKSRDTCDLLFLDIRAGDIKTQRGVDRTSVQRLMSAKKRRARQCLGGGGVFRACYHSMPV